MNPTQQEVFQASHHIPIVVQFFATWCGPCQVLKPVMSDLEAKANGAWRLASVNVEQSPEFAAAYGIKSIPTVMLFHQEKVLARFTGGKPAYIIQNWLDTNLPGNAYQGEYQHVDEALRQGDIDKAKTGIFDAILDKFQDAPLLKLLKALDIVGKDNNTARDVLEKLDRQGPLGALIKKVRDMIDIDEDEKSVRTPTSSPYHPKVTDIHRDIDINAINIELLNALVLRGVNEVRNRNGVGDLQEHPILSAAALDHNNYQIRFDQLTHYQDGGQKATVKDRILAFGGNQFRMMAENVQYKGFPRRTYGGRTEVITNSYQQSAIELVNNWVGSPGHYKNLINPNYRYAGTAVGWNVENASLFATQVFGA